MKNIYTFLTAFLLVLLTTGCSKEELAMDTPAAVKLRLRGFATKDTLEFVSGDTVLLTAIPDNGFDQVFLLVVKEKTRQLQIRKKGTTAVIESLGIQAAPFDQEKKIYYDGVKVSDNIELTPVKDAHNGGMRLMFTTDYRYFYGGPVDIEIFHRRIDMSTFEYSDSSVKMLRNVTGSFGEFIELPEVISTDQLWESYVFKVYKAGTTELPYTEGADYSSMYDPYNNYGDLPLAVGKSELLVISPYYNDGGAALGDGYAVQDLGVYFR